jgi:hypothetical protein
VRSPIAPIRRSNAAGARFTTSAGEITRLLDRSAPVGGCRVYGGALDKDGYAVVKHAGKSHRAVRVIWEAEFGSIPPGLQVCHACDNPPCIERSHLMLGTQAANVRDAIAKGRRPARRAA